MEYTTLGSTGLTVSELCLGTAHFGKGSRGWRLDDERSKEIVERAIELGITFFDTANVYSGGESEEVLGDALAEYDRDRLVVATKVYNDMDSANPNASGLSRKAIEQELENSLDRLGMETIDLYQIHRFDYDTPIEETLRTLDDAVRRGQVRYIGASSMWAHQFAEMLHASDRLGLERFVSMQNHYNPVYREEEREMLPLCENEGVGCIPWSPLARGYVTRPHEEYETTERGSQEADRREERLTIYRSGGGVEINRRIKELAAREGISMAQISIAWHLRKDAVTAPVIGPSSVSQLEDAVEALDVELSDDDVEYLEEPYEPVPISGHS